VNETVTERNKFKKLFSNTTSRALLGAWLLLKGSSFPMRSVSELISLPEDALDPKLQTFAGVGLIHVVTNAQGDRLVEFLPPATPELEKIIWELFDGRKNDFEAVELKVRSLIYKSIMTAII
jgi:hypothetical protein